jgi:hypothetical protein
MSIGKKIAHQAEVVKGGAKRMLGRLTAAACPHAGRLLRIAHGGYWA